jgi:site-specific DNA-cytosine methylase
VSGGANDAMNTAESLLAPTVAELFCPLVLTFESVVGMWQMEPIKNYLYPILMKLLRLRYQVRQMCLRACDFGDPQIRPRLFFLRPRLMFLSPRFLGSPMVVLVSMAKPKMDWSHVSQLEMPCESLRISIK